MTVAAVDIGILNLTHYQDARSDRLFLRPAQAGVDIRDLYGYLIDGMEGVAGALHVGGDGCGNLEGNLPTQAPLALFSGVVKVGADGKAEIPLRPARLQRRGAGDGGRLDQDARSARPQST